MPLNIGEKIRKVRDLRGFSQDYVAQKLGISQRTYGKLETGETKLDVPRIEKIADILEIEPFSLITFDEKMLFNNYNHATQGFFSTIHTSEGIKEVYKERIQQLENENTFLKEEISFLRSLIKKEK